MKYLVKITQEYINKGTRNSPKYCPIGLALNEIEGLDFGVTTAYIRASDEETKYCVIPDVAVDFIYNFDRKLPVEPFEFILDTEDLHPEFHNNEQ